MPVLRCVLSNCFFLAFKFQVAWHPAPRKVRVVNFYSILIPITQIRSGIIFRMRLEVRFFVGLVAVLVTYLVTILGHHGLLFPCKTQIASSITKYSGLKNETNFSLPGTAKLNKRNTDEDMAAALNLSSMMSPLCAGDHSCDFTCPLGVNFSVRASLDVVSENGGAWETELVKVCIFVLHRQLAIGHNGNHPVFLDIGANLGIFTFHVAARGFHVISIEPMPANRFHIYHTMQNSNLLRSHIHIIPVGLADTQRLNCGIWAHEFNLGNGQVTQHVSIFYPSQY